MTKTIFLAALAAISTPDAFAQEAATTPPVSPISKGHVTIGTGIGLASFGYGKGSDNRNLLYYNVSLNPSVGYFLTDHWMLSGEVLASASGTTRPRNPSSQSAGIGLAARYYIGKPVDAKGSINRLRFFAEAGGSYERLWSTGLVNGIQDHYTANGAILKAGAGFNYLLNDNVAFEAGVSGRRIMSGDRNYWNYNSRLRLELGVRVFLNRR